VTHVSAKGNLICVFTACVSRRDFRELALCSSDPGTGTEPRRKPALNKHACRALSGSIVRSPSCTFRRRLFRQAHPPWLQYGPCVDARHLRHERLSLQSCAAVGLHRVLTLEVVRCGVSNHSASPMISRLPGYHTELLTCPKPPLSRARSAPWSGSPRP
jgi:hypothetical protein